MLGWRKAPKQRPDPLEQCDNRQQLVLYIYRQVPVLRNEIAVEVDIPIHHYSMLLSDYVVKDIYQPCLRALS